MTTWLKELLNNWKDFFKFGPGSINGQGGGLIADTVQVTLVSLTGAALRVRTGSVDNLMLQGGSLNGVGAASSALSVTKKATLTSGTSSPLILCFDEVLALYC